MAASVRDVADPYIEELAYLDPLWATMRGILGYDDAMTDLSPEGITARAELTSRTLAALSSAEVTDEGDRIARDLMVERLTVARDLHDAGEDLRSLRVIGSPVGGVRQVFDIMPRASDDDWATIAARMARVPEALVGLRQTLEEGMAKGIFAARRQALACADQAATWGGAKAGMAPFFPTLVERYEGDGALRADLAAAAAAATDAYASLWRFLQNDYAAAAPEADAVGRDRYGLWFRAANGVEGDLEEAYAWGWEELHRLETEMEATAERILPGAGLDAAVELLETDPARAVDGEDALRGWLQEIMDEAIDALDGVHFDIPDPVKTVEAMIAPPGGAAAMYYTGPSEDFSRPGRTWYPTLGKTRFPMWGEVSTAYHEGVPGHHLQIAQVRWLGDRLNRYQRGAFVSGHSEGWALYAERLMDELGFLENPDHRLGMLSAHAFRAARVVVDLGLHLRLPIPEGEAFHGGEAWTPELAHELIATRGRLDDAFTASEIVRYLGWPAQATSYKLGERVWVAARAEVERREAAGFDLKAFHARSLDLGPLGLGQLHDELVR